MNKYLAKAGRYEQNSVSRQVDVMCLSCAAALELKGGTAEGVGWWVCWDASLGTCALDKQAPLLSGCCESLLRAAVLVLQGGELKH